MPSTFELFSPPAQRALDLASKQAIEIQHSLVEPQHLLLALLQAEHTTIANILVVHHQVKMWRVRELVIRMTPKTMESSSIQLSPEMKKVLRLAIVESLNRKHTYVGTEHLMIGIIHQKRNIANLILERLNVQPEEIEFEIDRYWATLDQKSLEEGNSSINDMQQDKGQSEFKPPLHGTIHRFELRWADVIRIADLEAMRLHHTRIGTEHVLLVLLQEETNWAGNILRSLGLNAGMILDLLKTMPAEIEATANLPFSPDLIKAIGVAFEQVYQERRADSIIGYLLFGILQDENPATEIIKKLGFEIDTVKKAVGLTSR